MWWYGCSGGGGVVVVGYGTVALLGTPVVAVGLGMSFSVFSGLGVGLGLQVDSPHRIPTNSQVILSGHLSMSTFTSTNYRKDILWGSPLDLLE